MLIAIQYLEGSQNPDHLHPQEVKDTLRKAFDILPITHLLIGWNLSESILEICRREADRAGARFYRWHPLLTGDGVFTVQPEWQIIGLNGKSVHGATNPPEFIFACPNNPQVITRIQNRISEIVKSRIYQGFFLDRIRWPSPAAHPFADLGCFCPSCHDEAAKADLNLAEVQKHLQNISCTTGGKIDLIRSLLTSKEDKQDGELVDIQNWLTFREQCITRVVQRVSTQLRLAGLEIGLDCFSPGLTRMVGQDLTALSSHADWIKVMTYAHTLGPAGLPYELLGTLDFLTSECEQTEQEALESLAHWLELPLPSDRRSLATTGLDEKALTIELHKGIHSINRLLFTGLELVEVSGVTCLDDAQIQRDHFAARNSGVNGVSISWDLQHIPFERLELISMIWSA